MASPAKVLTAFGIKSGETILEIGSGTGFYTLEAARRVGPSGRLLCLDVQACMLLHTRGRLAAAGLAAHLVQSNAHALPLRDASVDHVFMVSVLGEIRDRQAVLAEIGRVLRPEGRLSVSEQFPDPDFVTLRQLRNELAKSAFVEQRSKGILWYTSTWSRAIPASST